MNEETRQLARTLGIEIIARTESGRTTVGHQRQLRTRRGPHVIGRTSMKGRKSCESIHVGTALPDAIAVAFKLLTIHVGRPHVRPVVGEWWPSNGRLIVGGEKLRAFDGVEALNILADRLQLRRPITVVGGRER